MVVCFVWSCWGYNNTVAWPSVNDTMEDIAFSDWPGQPVDLAGSNPWLPAYGFQPPTALLEREDFLGHPGGVNYCYWTVDMVTKFLMLQNRSIIAVRIIPLNIIRKSHKSWYKLVRGSVHHVWSAIGNYPYVDTWHTYRSRETLCVKADGTEITKLLQYRLLLFIKSSVMAKLVQKFMDINFHDFAITFKRLKIRNTETAL